MPISPGFWEWGCPKRGDAHITVTAPPFRQFLYSDYPLVTDLVTQLRIQRNDGWAIVRWCLVTKCISSCYLFCFFVRNIECSRHSFRKMCWTVLTTGAGKFKGRKPEPCHWVGELEEEGCLLYLEEEWRYGPLSYGPWNTNLSFSFLDKVFSSMISKLFFLLEVVHSLS